MTDANKLAELIKKAESKMWGKTFRSELERNFFLAEELLANGVFLLPEDLRGTEDFSVSAFIEATQMYKEKDRYIKLPCKVGDKVYILEEKCKFSGEENKPWDSCNQYWDNVFKNKMWGCNGKAENGSLIYCKQKEMVWYVKEVEYSLLFYSNPTKVFGENLFLTKKEAEKKLKELGK